MKNKNLLLKQNVKYIVIHCSDTNEDDTAIDIHQLHLSFGWEGVGYHKIIQKNGEIENGRPEFWTGAHVFGYNKESLGICLIGKDNFSTQQFNTLTNLIKEWKKKYPLAKICGHRDFKNTKKTCPNFDVKKWLELQQLS
ncbi:MAG: N-acetylmuramoyl-L-alanine amidase [SAR116 cluster bacterium]|nr:N-acetylmuramoyl-L-alanine amidase [SAR116 cluster bacterium]RPH08555.1 MAG: N-acetylmuramoyl-L-alanine amidase [Alphaproteobacteria bacterium TMED54]